MVLRNSLRLLALVKQADFRKCARIKKRSQHPHSVGNSLGQCRDRWEMEDSLAIAAHSI
ncbi:unnamed protein product [Nesidiocoris tenuis]|uniref:Uncharacterized protein n=1 Tax=Nesidiocoris tenuis TaxID=355587 RepID=A0A6H5HLV8_9HEMI|nr:unnamed protein product [Nesidiocoris tenuis]